MRVPRKPAEAMTLADLETDPHPVLARLRDAAPACWVPALGAWLVTGYEPAVDVLRDARAFTVDDPLLHGQGGRAEHALARRGLVFRKPARLVVRWNTP